MTELNNTHKRSFLIGLQRIDDMLSEIERVIGTSEDFRSPFRKYVTDITEAQQETIAGAIEHMRQEICRILASKDIEIDHPGISAIRAVRNAIYFADMAAEEMRPKYMKGYGALTEGAKRELNEVASHLQELLTQMLDILRND